MKLSEMTCNPIKKGSPPLSHAEAEALMPQIPAWALGEKEISREFRLGDFREAMLFVNKIALAANEQDHHPDIRISYKIVQLTLTTHAVGGLSLNDFILAAKIDLLTIITNTADTITMAQLTETGKTVQSKLKGRVALITGAGRRIGHAIVMALAEAGVNIVAHDRGGPGTETIRVCEEAIGRGVRSWRVSADLEKPEEYETLIARALAVAGSLDIVINNASLFKPNTLSNVDLASLTQQVHVNAWTPLVLSREFARLVGRGKIVNILDARITGQDRTHTAYLLSKQMLADITRLCAVEFAPNISVNAVAPGLILPPAGKDEAYLDRLANQLPLKRHGGTDDIADAVLYLLKSDFVTGQVIFVDGGLHLLEEQHGPHTDS